MRSVPSPATVTSSHGDRADGAQQLDVDPGLAQRRARELAEQVGAVGADGAGAAAQAQRGAQRDRDAGSGAGGERGEVGRGGVDARQVRAKPRDRDADPAEANDERRVHGPIIPQRTGRERR